MAIRWMDYIRIKFALFQDGGWLLSRFLRYSGFWEDDSGEKTYTYELGNNWETCAFYLCKL